MIYDSIRQIALHQLGIDCQMHSWEGQVVYPEIFSQDEIASLEAQVSLGSSVGCQINVKKHWFLFERAFLVCSFLIL